MRPPNWLIAAFIAAVLALLTSLLLILSFRMQGTLVELSHTTDRAIKTGDEINAIFSDEIVSIVGFQATGKLQYSQEYQAQRASIDGRVRNLEGVSPQLSPNVEARFSELQAAIKAWHQHVDSLELTTRRLRSGTFRDVVFEHLPLMKRAQASTDSFNEAVLAYHSARRARVQRLAHLFIALAVVFGPLAGLALVIMMVALRRLSATTSYMEGRAHEEEMLRQVGHRLAGALTMNDVLHRITEVTAPLVQADEVCIEKVVVQLNEATCVAGRGDLVPVTGSTCSYVGSLAHDVLQAGHPRIIGHADIEGQPESLFRNFVRRSRNRSAMVVPLKVENLPFGAICLIRDGPHAFTYAEVPKLRILADMASIALHRAMTVEELQKLEDEEHSLIQVTAALTSSLDYDRILKTIAQLALTQMADWCIVHLVERNRVYHAELRCADPAMNAIAQQWRDKHRARPDLTISVESAIRTRRALLVSELSDQLLEAHSVDKEHLNLLRQLNLKSAMIVPLTVGHEVIGALLLLTAGSRRYNDDDLRRARKFGRHAALAIHNAQMYAVAKDAIHSRDQVLQAVAHDLRSPLNTIQLSAEILGGNSLPYERRQTLLQSITGSSRRMNRLIDDLLTVARLRADQKLPLDLHREDPVDIVQQVCQMMGPQAVAKSVALRSTKPWTPLPSIIVDRSRILQVFTNVLDNALKFTSPGGSITVSCESADGDIRFAVQDTGSGIDAADVNRIFDPFWQVRETAHLGAGIGLAIAKAIVEQHHGRIWVESQPGMGTTVTFTVPVAGTHEAPLKAA
jgi:signal transduction histidine kinase